MLLFLTGQRRRLTRYETRKQNIHVVNDDSRDCSVGNTDTRLNDETDTAAVNDRHRHHDSIIWARKKYLQACAFLACYCLSETLGRNDDGTAGTAVDH